MRNLKYFAVTIAMLLCCITSSAETETFTVDGIKYSTTSESTVSIVKGSYSGDIVIPSTVTWNEIVYNVTSIDIYAFRGNTSLTSISLPESFTSIGSQAFFGCSSLTSISLPESLTSIGSYAFSGCSSLTSINLPESLTSISSGAFEECTSLTDIHIASISSWFNLEFYKGTNEQFSHPLRCNSKQKNLYLGEELITDLVVPEGVTAIPDYAFYYSDDITSVSLPKGLTSIGSNAFYGCTSLNDIHLASISSWFDIEFKNSYAHPLRCNSLNKNLFWGDELITDLVIPEEVTVIPDYAFYYCDDITSVSLPEGVTSIGSSAFSKCTSLTSANLSEGVTSIGSYAFQYCTSLTSISLPESITSIDLYAFEKCSNLTDIHLASISSWFNIEFYKGINDQYAHPLRCNSLNKNLFWGDELITDLVIPEGATAIPDYAFYYCDDITSISLPEGVTSIGSYAFYNCSSLTDIHIASISSWFDIEFKNGNAHPLRCNSKQKNLYLGEELITDLVVPEGVTAIPNYAFYYCDGITSVSLPEGLTSIGSCAFRYCSSLTSISLPESITSIGSDAFTSCSNLTDIHLANVSSWFNIEFENSGAHPLRCNSLNKNLFLSDELITELVIPEGATTIPNYAFYYCDGITSVSLPEGLTSIGSCAFQYCSSLTSANLPEGVTSIGSDAFCACTNLTSISLPESITSIGSDAFEKCSNLTDIHLASIASWFNIEFYKGTNNHYAHPLLCNSKQKNLYLGEELITDLVVPEGVTAIPDYAFLRCDDIKSVTLSEGLTSIGSSAFSNCSALGELHLLGTTPPALTSTNFVPTNPIFIVPEEAYDTYCAAPYWADIKDRITTDALCTQSVELTAAKDKSDLQVQIGDDKLRFVTDLAISGTINSYDFMILRNKMPLLRHLDLSQANIVANSYEHYTGYHTKDNIFPAYGLYNCNLITLSFPASIKSIEIQGLSSNDYLREISIHEGVTSIGSSAFSGCGSLSSVNLPEGVTSIGSLAFKNCSSLTSISLPESLTSIGSDAFYNCSSLTSVKLSPNLKTIGSSAFYSCSKLSEIHIPASVRSIGDYAFYSCSNMEDVYVYIVEPTDIGQNTFTKSGNNFIGTLHAPKVSYWDYYYNTQWSQFLEFAEFDGKYDNFYLEGDKVLDNNTGSIEGEEGKNPDAEMGENSGIIVEDDVNQNLGDVDIEHDGENGGSIIVDGTGDVDFENLNFRISVKGGRWYFFCFPFDVRAEDIRCESGAEWVFRYYDGEERAQNGKGGWKNVTSDSEGNMLKAARGYIFQSSKDDVLVLTAKNGKIKQENKYNELVEHVTENMHDASWNFVGNPYLSYYEVTSEDYSAPITVWDGSKYIAIRPGDDDYQLAPFEAFFVQKPEGVAQVSYNSENQMTYTQASEAAAQARQARAQQAINPNRLLVNITLTDGKETDRARVVFNESAEAGYETECDAAKFGTDGVPQIYTMDSNNVKYAINERPMAQGNVSMGYSVPKQGTYTLAATRMDIAVYLMDNLTGTVHDLAKGGYEFCSESGTFGSRFTLIVKGDATGIDDVLDADADAPIYNVKGQQVKDMNHSDIYIQNNHKMVKK